MAIRCSLIMSMILKLTGLLRLCFELICLDVSSNKVTFRIREQWDVVKYSDPTTKEYAKLKQRMLEEVNLFIYLFIHLFIYSFNNVFVF